MATYTLPKVDTSIEEKERGLSVAEDIVWRRKISLPANKAIIESITVGEDVVVVLRATAEGISYRERDGEKHADFDLDLDSVKVSSAGNEFSELAEDDDEG